MIARDVPFEELDAIRQRAKAREVESVQSEGLALACAMDDKHRMDVLADLIDSAREGNIEECRRIVEAATGFVCDSIWERKE